MNKFISIHDIENVNNMINKAIAIKKEPFKYCNLGIHSTLVMLLFNASLRTRLSTEKAAKNLGMDVMVLNINNIWNLEFQDGTIMKFKTAEHVKEAARVISQYANIIAIRAFAELKNQQIDESEYIISNFVKYATVPIVNLESATEHPLQALADAITIKEQFYQRKPKVVLSWAPHPKALPHAVANSFVLIMKRLDVNLSIVQPKSYELNSKITENIPVLYDQNEALRNADVVYVKNWSSYSKYGEVLQQEESWMMTQDKLNQAKFMHCLPVRRNVVVEDAILDGSNSLVIHQAENRIYASQIILKTLLEHLSR